MTILHPNDANLRMLIPKPDNLNTRCLDNKPNNHKPS